MRQSLGDVTPWRPLDTRLPWSGALLAPDYEQTPRDQIHPRLSLEIGLTIIGVEYGPFAPGVATGRSQTIPACFRQRTGQDQCGGT